MKVLPPEVINQLSSDQKYLYEMCCSIEAGFVSKELQARSPGKLHHARWLTRANRILRLYVSEKTPSKHIIDLVKIITQLYAPCWFKIKCHPNSQEGASNFWYMTFMMRNLECDYKKIMEKSLKTNSYFAHLENILLNMMNDERQHIRELAVQRILEARSSHDSIRNFKLPSKINFEANDYVDLIDWKNESITSPPILRNITNEDILKARSQPLKIMPFPCHSQGVEHAINLVTQASEVRIGYIN